MIGKTEITEITNKYGIKFSVGDFVFLPLEFYSHGIWKILKIEDDTYIGGNGRLWVDQGGKHIRGFSVDNPFIKVDEECGKILFENSDFKEKILET